MKLFSSKNSPKIHNYKKYVIEKAKQRDLRALRDGLLEWARHHYRRQSINSLKDIEELSNDQQFECELEKLTEALYAKQATDWKSGSFIKVFERVTRKKYQKKEDNEPLPKLYK